MALLINNMDEEEPLLSPEANLSEVNGYPTPMINLSVRVKGKGRYNKLETVRALPDTGTSVDCVQEKFVKRHKLTIKPENEYMDLQLLAAEGNEMLVSGTTTLEVSLSSGPWTAVEALVCPRLSHTMLISWTTQKALGLIH